MQSPNLALWLTALHAQGIGLQKFHAALQYFQNIENVFAATFEQLNVFGLNERQIQALQQPDTKAIDTAMDWLQEENHSLITYDDLAYPALLKEISDPPLVLFVLGRSDMLNKPQIAIVGARGATPAGIKNADYFARALAGAGITVTSGLALGVDAAAHVAALREPGSTVAVIGTGINQVYPSQHKKLFAQIANEGGAIVSEFPLDTKPLAHHFPRRNRLIAGMSMGTLIVEAALKSGSLITARHAFEHGREVFAIPGSIHNPLVRGCHHLIRQGAKLVETVADIFEEIGAIASTFQAETSQEIGTLPAEEVSILTQIGYEITPLDVIILRSGLTPALVSSMLLSLELSGLIQSVPGGYMRI